MKALINRIKLDYKNLYCSPTNRECELGLDPIVLFTHLGETWSRMSLNLGKSPLSYRSQCPTYAVCIHIYMYVLAKNSPERLKFPIERFAAM